MYVCTTFELQQVRFWHLNIPVLLPPARDAWRCFQASRLLLAGEWQLSAGQWTHVCLTWFLCLVIGCVVREAAAPSGERDESAQCCVLEPWPRFLLC